MELTRIETAESLAFYMDDIATAIHKALKRTGMHGTSPEVLMRSIVMKATSPDTYLLIGTDEKGFAGIIYAYYLATTPPYVEVPILWTRAGIGVMCKEKVWKMLREWSRDKGAKWILSCIIRDYERFFKWFHEPLGFKKVGILVRAPVEDDDASPMAS